MEKWIDPQTIIIWITIVFFTMMILIFSIIKIVKINFRKQIENQKKENQLIIEHQKELMQNSIKAQEQERSRIAADLHDSLIGKLTVLKMKTSLDIEVDEIISSLEESIVEARRISHDLSPPMIENLALNELLENLIYNWKKFYKISFRQNIINNRDISESLKLNIIRIIQEQIVNTHKHAKATEIELYYKQSQKKLLIIYKDNGKGFDTTHINKGIGLQNINQRLQNYDCQFKIKSSINGTRFILNIKS